jgi:hypothetical protein
VCVAAAVFIYEGGMMQVLRRQECVCVCVYMEGTECGGQLCGHG